RTVEPFDGPKELRALWPHLDEVRDPGSGQVYFKLRKNEFRGPKPGCVYFPDDRTVVFDEEPKLLRLIRRAAPTAPESARGDDWDRLSRGLLAVALDNRDGRLSRLLDVDDQEDAEIAPLIEHAEHWVFGLEDSDDFLFRVIATCAGAGESRETSEVL